MRIEDISEGWLWRRAVHPVDAQIDPLLGQPRWPVQPRRLKRGGPLADPEMMVKVRRIEVRYRPQRLDGRTAAWRHRYWRVRSKLLSPSRSTAIVAASRMPRKGTGSLVTQTPGANARSSSAVMRRLPES
jgi:hypothetical protein